MREHEYLLIRGRLNRADDFTPRRCGSTTFVREWPRAEGSDVFAETVSRAGDVLRSHPALVRSESVCAPGPESWRLRAYVPLDAEAARVRLRRGVRVIWEEGIPDAPRVAVSLQSRPRRGDAASTTTLRRRRHEREGGGVTPGFPGGSPAVIALDTSDPAPGGGAFVTVVHQWSERGFRTIYIGPVQPTLEIPADRLPGGRECRFVAIYSNGLRSATAVTRPFALEPIGPILRVTRPADGERVSEGTPVTLEGMVQDPEHPSGPQNLERLVWSIDQLQVGTGPVTSVDALESGEHTITLSYRGPAPLSTSVRVVVRKAQTDPANAWPAWNPFEEH
jgi:hypothetical protein